VLGREEEFRVRLAAEVVTQHPKRSDRIAKGLGRVRRGATLDEVGAQGLILPLLGMGGFEEKLTAGD